MPSSTIADFGPLQQDSFHLEPPVPFVGGVDTQIPDADGPDEVDCVDAERLCDEGVYACDDLADFCDVGPDGLEELPDEYDWDGN